jgi:dipeptidyl aminopeptidase/acylaminoacyl peptidase
MNARASFRRRALVGTIALLLSLTPTGAITAQETNSSETATTVRHAVTPDDYGRWERLGFSRELSRDGNWAAVPIQRVDGTAELQLLALGAEADPIVLDQGGSPEFSRDGAWLAYRIGPSEEEAERLRAADEPVRNDAALLRLGDADPLVIEDVQRFALSGSGAAFAALRYPEEGARTSPLLVRDLATGTELVFGNVAEFAWQSDGDLLAIVVSTPDGVGNGVQLYDAATGSLRVLDSARVEHARLSWRDESPDLAYFQAVETEDWEGSTHRLVAWRDLDAGGVRTVLEPVRVEALGPSWGVAEHRAPAWSEDGDLLFFEMQRRVAREHEEATDDAASAGESAGGPGDGDPEGDEGVQSEPQAPPLPESNVQVWHSRDERIQPMQRVYEDRDLERGYLTAWHLDENRVVRLANDRYESTVRVPGDRWAVESDRAPYRDENRFDLERHDYWLVDIATGDRRKVIEGVTFYEGPSAGGRYLLYFLGEDWFAYDIREDRTIDLTGALPADFVDTDYDTPTRHGDPPWGSGGWLDEDAAVLLYDRFDVWAVRPGGAGALQVTEGASEQVRHRVARTDGRGFFSRDNDAVPSDPLWLSLYGERTKWSGFARVNLGGEAPVDVADPGVDRLLWMSAMVTGLQKAEEADRYVWVEERYDDSPDLFTAGADLADGRQVTETNPFQEDYLWGRSELIDYRNSRGEQLQGALYYPADYDPGQTYPMIVYVYEKLSQGLHGYVVPSERSPYDTAVFSAEGYFVLRPDIIFHDREPGISATDCVTAAVEAVLATGMVDRDRVGLVGHSWGGYEAAFIPTQTDLFAASVAGAALTNFFSMFGTIHWNQGMPEVAHFETGQARMEVPYWEDMEAYARNSPVMHITELNTPMLLFHGDSDGVVDWHQGVEMYNYARRAGKFLVMLVYPGENHSAGRKENQIDYHHRVLQWFGHFLKGDEAPAWITEGAPVVLEPGEQSEQ